MAEAESYEQIVARLGELHKQLKHTQSRMLEEYHVSLMEYHIMIIIARMHEVSQNELAEMLDVDKALISRHIQAMELKGLLSCQADPDCRRKKLLTLSASATAIIPRLQEVHHRSLEQLFAEFDDEQLKVFQFILEGLVSKL